ncbi:MAG: hypothetical protein HLUCCO06_09750 [Halomonas sp. HL-93]|nr:MAG: hypothetical protein HLUCCO06_09750 [Halomonas sp. HL-93]
MPHNLHVHLAEKLQARRETWQSTGLGRYQSEARAALAVRVSTKLHPSASLLPIFKPKASTVSLKYLMTFMRWQCEGTLLHIQSG